MKTARVRLLFVAVVCLLALAPGLAYDPGHDSNSDGRIDAVDLLHFLQHWHTSDEAGQPTATPTSGGTATPTYTATTAAGATATPTDTRVSQTATPTTADDTPTVTFTRTPSPTGAGSGARLHLRVCETQCYVDDDLRFRVFLVDDSDRLVNPGMPGGAAAVNVTLTCTGSARFVGDNTNEVVKPLENPQGMHFTLTDSVAETVQVSVSAPGYSGAGSGDLTFLSAARVHGTLEGTMNGAPGPMTLTSALVKLMQDGSEDLVALTRYDGTFEITSIPPGTYNTEFSGPMYDMGFLFTADCTTHTPLTLAAGENRNLGTITLLQDENPGTIEGTLSLSDTTPPDDVSLAVMCVLESAQCGADVRMAIPSGGAYSVQVEPGDYQLVANGQTSGATATYALANEVHVSVAAGQTVTQDLTLLLYDSIVPTAPLDYARAGATPTFTWADAGLERYIVTVTDSCANVLWESDPVATTSVQYAGPALDALEVYTWNITGYTSQGETVTAFGRLAADDSQRVSFVTN